MWEGNEVIGQNVWYLVGRMVRYLGRIVLEEWYMYLGEWGVVGVGCLVGESVSVWEGRNQVEMCRYYILGPQDHGICCVISFLACSFVATSLGQ